MYPILIAKHDPWHIIRECMSTLRGGGGGRLAYPFHWDLGQMWIESFFPESWKLDTSCGLHELVLWGMHPSSPPLLTDANILKQQCLYMPSIFVGDELTGLGLWGLSPHTSRWDSSRNPSLGLLLLSEAVLIPPQSIEKGFWTVSSTRSRWYPCTVLSI